MKIIMRQALVLCWLMWTFGGTHSAFAGNEQQSEQNAGKPGEQKSQPEAPPPASWTPAGVITEPGPTAAAASAPAIPKPLFSYGSFELSPHAFLQVVGGITQDDCSIDNGDLLEHNGFKVTNARLGVEGKLLEAWEYFLEMNIVDGTSGGLKMLDATITYRPAEFLWIRGGNTKPPFSRTFLASDNGLQFIERPVWIPLERATDVNQLYLGRQVGIGVGGKLGPVDAVVGVFNGAPGFGKGDLDDGFLYVVRLTVGQGDVGKSEPDLDGGGLRWRLGFNGYLNYATNEQVRAAGIDLSAKFKGLSFYAEAVWAKTIPDSKTVENGIVVAETERWGMYAQAGYILPFDFTKLDVAVRFAIMDSDVHVDDAGDAWTLTAGINDYLYKDFIKVMANFTLRQELHGPELLNNLFMLGLQLRY